SRIAHRATRITHRVTRIALLGSQCATRLPAPSVAPRSRKLRAQDPRRLGFVAELPVCFIDAHDGTRSGREATIRVQRDPLWIQILCRLADSRRNRLGVVDPAGGHIDAPKPDLE